LEARNSKISLQAPLGPLWSPKTCPTTVIKALASKAVSSRLKEIRAGVKSVIFMLVSECAQHGKVTYCHKSKSGSKGNHTKGSKKYATKALTGSLPQRCGISNVNRKPKVVFLIHIISLVNGGNSKNRTCVSLML
jgi:hypothetical protein